MGTQRYISTSFYDDRWIQSLDPTEKFIYLYLLTNPLTNIAGVYKIEDRRISFDTGYTKEVVGFVLDKFEKAGKAYRMDEYIVIPSWPKHQKWDKAPKIKQGIILNLMALEEKYLKKIAEMNYRFDLRIVLDRLSIPYERVFSVDHDTKYPSNYSDLDPDPDINSDLNNTGSSNEEVKPQLSDSQKAANELAELLLTSHRKEFPDFLSGKKEKDIQRELAGWATDIEKLIRLDKKTPENIRLVIYWIKTNDNFWLPNIISGKKLREKYETVWAQMQSRGSTPNHRIAADNVAQEKVTSYFREAK